MLSAKYQLFCPGLIVLKASQLKSLLFDDILTFLTWILIGLQSCGLTIRSYKKKQCEDFNLTRLHHDMEALPEDNKALVFSNL